MDVLGRLPVEDEWKEIRSLLGILQRAGFSVDDPSNAPHVTLFAWGWARSTPRADVLAAVKAAVMELGTAATPSPDLTPVLSAVQGLQIAAARPVTVKVDEGMVSEAVARAFREPISQASMTILGMVIVVALFVGSWWGKHQLEATVQMQQQMIQKLTAPDHASRSGK